MKRIGLILCLAIAGCGGGGGSAPESMAVRLADGTVLPSPFALGAPDTAPVNFVVGPDGPHPATVNFVVGPVVGPIAIVTPPIIVTVPVVYPINYCTNGFVVGPCTPLPKTCQPDASGFVIGPC